MLHHISLPVPVRDLSTPQALYDAVMQAIGYRCAFTSETAVGYGIEDGKDKLCLICNPNAEAASEGFHLAFAAPSRLVVDEFHEAALDSGARDNGKPGIRKNYGPNYCAAFVVDFDGHRLEAVHK